MDESQHYITYLGRTVSDRVSNSGKTINIRFFGKRMDGHIWYNGGFSPNRLDLLAGTIAGYAGSSPIQIEHPPFKFLSDDWEKKLPAGKQEYERTVAQVRNIERLTDLELETLKFFLSPERIKEVRQEIPEWCR